MPNVEKTELLRSVNRVDLERAGGLLRNSDLPSWIEGNALLVRNEDVGAANEVLAAVESLRTLPPTGVPEAFLPWYRQPGAVALVAVVLVALVLDYRVFVMVAMLVGGGLLLRYFLTMRRGGDRFAGPGPTADEPTGGLALRWGRKKP